MLTCKVKAGFYKDFKINNLSLQTKRVSVILKVFSKNLLFFNSAVIEKQLLSNLSASAWTIQTIVKFPKFLE